MRSWKWLSILNMQKLNNFLKKKNDIQISENQKDIVKKRVEYYELSPHELISENEAWEMINE